MFGERFGGLLGDECLGAESVQPSLSLPARACGTDLWDDTCAHGQDGRARIEVLFLYLGSGTVCDHVPHNVRRAGLQTGRV